MTVRLPLFCLFLTTSSVLGACGAVGENGDYIDEGEEAADAESIGETEQALTDVPGLTVKAWVPSADGLGHYKGQCQTSYKDGNHLIDNQCTVQQYYGSAWHADPDGWVDNSGIANGVGNTPRRGCTPGNPYTLRTVSKGRVSINGRWTDFEQVISISTRLICPRG